MAKSRAHFPRNRMLATIYGQAAGDAIGLLTEFLTKAEAAEDYGKVRQHMELKHKDLVADVHRTRWETGDWTDDTDQMILILESLTDRGGQVTPEDFAVKLKNWSKEGFKELGDCVGMGIGSTTSAVMHHPEYLSDPIKAARDVWVKKGKNIAPNGGVMRTSIVGVHQYWDPDVVAQNARKFCSVSHYDPRCQASVVAVSVAISLMLKREARHLKWNRKYNVDAIIQDSFQAAAKCLATEEEKAELKHYMMCTDIKELALGDARIGYTYKCMASGFWALKRNNFRKSLQKVIMEGGDADTNGAVAGALLGCKLGLSGLPRSWVNKLKHKAWLDEKIEKYFVILLKMKADEESAVQIHGGKEAQLKEEGKDLQ